MSLSSKNPRPFECTEPSKLWVGMAAWAALVTKNISSSSTLLQLSPLGMTEWCDDALLGCAMNQQAEAQGHRATHFCSFC